MARWHDRYGSDPANLAHASLPALLAATGKTLAGCAAVLRPGGLVVLTAGRDGAATWSRRWEWFISDHGNPHRIDPGRD